MPRLGVSACKPVISLYNIRHKNVHKVIVLKSEITLKRPDKVKWARILRQTAEGGPEEGRTRGPGGGEARGDLEEEGWGGGPEGVHHARSVYSRQCHLQAPATCRRQPRQARTPKGRCCVLWASDAVILKHMYLWCFSFMRRHAVDHGGPQFSLFLSLRHLLIRDFVHACNKWHRTLIECLCIGGHSTCLGVIREGMLEQNGTAAIMKSHNKKSVTMLQRQILKHGKGHPV